MKRILPRVVLVVLAVVLLTEVVLQVLDIPGDPLLLELFHGYVNPPTLFTKEDCSPAGEMYRSNPAWGHRLQMEIFAAGKTNRRRIFFLGDSRTAGSELRDSYPYLLAWLNTAAGNERYEVVNAAVHQADMAIVETVLPEVLRYRPDIVVIETGTSEFSNRASFSKLFSGGSISAPIMMRANLSRLRLWRLLESMGKSGDDSATAAEEAAPGVPKSTVEKKFEAGLTRVVQRLLEHTSGPVILVAPAFRAEPGAIEQVTAGVRWGSGGVRWGQGGDTSSERTTVSEAAARLAEGDPAGTLKFLESSAVLKSPEGKWAGLILRAQALQRLGKHREAYDAHRKAADCSRWPSQATAEMITAIRRLAREHDRVHLLDAAAMAEEAALNGEKVFRSSGGYSEAFSLVLAHQLDKLVSAPGQEPAENPPTPQSAPAPPEDSDAAAIVKPGIGRGRDFAEVISLPGWSEGLLALEGPSGPAASVVFLRLKRAQILMEGGEREDQAELSGIIKEIADSSLAVPLLLRSRDSDPFMVPVLIEALRSPRLRYPALQALMCVTGDYIGFGNTSSAMTMGDCIRKWEKWWDKHGRARAVTNRPTAKSRLEAALRTYKRGALVERAAACYILGRKLAWKPDPVLTGSRRQAAIEKIRDELDL